jgi:hypothetical protein
MAKVKRYSGYDHAKDVDWIYRWAVFFNTKKRLEVEFESFNDMPTDYWQETFDIFKIVMDRRLDESVF